MNKPLRILLVGADARLAEELAGRLTPDGFEPSEVRRADNEPEFQTALAERPDAVVVNGRTNRLCIETAVLAAQKSAGEPLIFLLADQNDAMEAVRFLRLGAHDVWFFSDLEYIPRSLGATIMQRNLRQARQSAEAGLRESEKLHRLLFESHPLSMWVCVDGDDTIVAVNNTAVLRYGFSRDEFMQMKLQSLRTSRPHTEGSGADGRPSPMRLEVEFPGVETCYHHRKDGSVFAAELFRHSIRFQDQPATLVVARDVSPWEALLEEFRELEHFHRLLVEQLPGIVYTLSVNRTGPSLRVSPQIEQMLGYTPDEWQTTPALWARNIHPADRERAAADEERQRQPGELVRSNYRMHDREGRMRWILDQSISVRHLRSGSRLSVGVMFDVSELKQLERSSRLHQHVLESTDDPVIVFSAELERAGLEVLCVNPAFTRLTGFRMEDFAGGDAALLLDGGNLHVEAEKLKRHLRFRRQFSGPLPTHRLNGDALTCDWLVRAVTDEHQETTHFVAFIRPSTVTDANAGKPVDLKSPRGQLLQPSGAIDVMA